VLYIVTMSSENPILNGCAFSVKDLSLGKPKINASNGKNIPIFNKHARKPLMLSTPMMLTWGVNENDFEGNGKKNYDMSIQFPSSEYMTPESIQFLSTMKEFEDYIKQEAVDKCKDWFGKPKMSMEVVEALYTPMLRYAKNKETNDIDYTKSPTLRIKLPYWEGRFDKMKAYDLERNLLFPNDEVSILDVIPKGSHVATIISCGGIWFANGKFGITWRLFQAMVKPKARLDPDVCHIELSDNDKKVLSKPEKDEIEPKDEHEAKDKAPQPESTVEVVDSDEDPEAEYKAKPEDNKQDTVLPVPTKGKKSVIKK